MRRLKRWPANRDSLLIIAQLRLRIKNITSRALLYSESSYYSASLGSGALGRPRAPRHQTLTLGLHLVHCLLHLMLLL